MNLDASRRILLRCIGYGVAVLAPIFLAGEVAWADYKLNLSPGVTEISQRVYELHQLMLIICTVIGLIVFGIMFWSIFRYRKSAGAVPASFSHSTKAEIAWTVIPVFILVGMAIPGTRALIDLEDTSAADMTIKVTGYQWKWRYDYLDEGFGYFSVLGEASNRARQLGAQEDPNKIPNYLLEVDNPLVLPVGKKVKILTTAGDVIHSWWVPALGWKRDAVPGFVRESWTNIKEPGIYRGQCAELCGRDHAFMPVVVKAVPEAEYRTWVTAQKAAFAAAGDVSREYSIAELVAKGEAVYNKLCVACHQPNGQGLAGAFPALAGSALTTGPLAAHVDIVLRGKSGTAMAAFGEQLNDVELAAVVTYERNAWGNDKKLAEGVAPMLAPADVQKYRRSGGP